MAREPEMPELTETTYSGKVVDVFSGDDICVMVDLRVEGLYKRQRVRLFGVDTPSAINAGPDSKAGEIRSYVRQITRDRPVTVTIKSRVGSSWVAVVVVNTRDGLLNLNDDLAAKGYEFTSKKAAP
jgi:endonuclease YncB( thermonuclease family)